MRLSLSRLVALSALIWVPAAAFLPAAALAQKPRDIDIQNFRPAMDSKGLVTLERSKALGTLEPSIGLYLNYAFDPLVQKIDGKDVAVVDNLGTANFVLAIGFANVVELGANLPVVIARGANDGPGDEPKLSADGFGDAQFSLKVRLLDREQHHVGIALVPSVVVNTGTGNSFTSQNQSVIFVPRLAVDWMLGSRVYMAVNGAARLRDRREFGDANSPITATDALGVVTTPTRDKSVIVGKDIQYGAGVGFILIPERLDLIFEGYGAVPLEDGADMANPLEAIGALKVFLAGNSFLTLGAGHGFMGAAGDPSLRLFSGIVFEPAIRDRDGDGLNDDIDTCPDDPEDKDEYEDTDGCPDEDNDSDGIVDAIDQCPDIPEDKNGFEDDDGCPEGKRDRDGDGIVDMIDKCPNDPEDKDGFEDADGCPDPDNDRDGILDNVDKCPNDPEDLDGFEDEDGCPDPDNDKDGVLDAVDKCPLQPEDIDNFEDADGCPDPDNDQDRIADAQDQCPNQPEDYDGDQDQDGCPDIYKNIIVRDDRIELKQTVYFATGRDTILSKSYPLLNEVALALRDNPTFTVSIEGHTDSQGAANVNQTLSQKRAEAVRRYLIDQGIAPTRLQAVGYGEDRPIEDNRTAEGRAANRRVEFHILQK